MKNKRGEKRLLFEILSLAVIVLFCFNLISGFGVGTPYWGGNPLMMDKGEVKVVELNLQNMVGTEDINAMLEIKQGSEIASLSKNLYLVKAGTYDNMVPVTIKIPRNAKTNQTWVVEIYVKSAPASGGEGMVAMGTGMTVAFDVIVSDKQAKRTALEIILIIVPIVIVLLIIVILIKKFRQKSISVKKKR